MGSRLPGAMLSVASRPSTRSSTTVRGSGTTVPCRSIRRWVRLAGGSARSRIADQPTNPQRAQNWNSSKSKIALTESHAIAIQRRVESHIARKMKQGNRTST